MGVSVDLYLWSLSERADPASLSSDEQARADRFVYDRHRHAYIAARVGLRERLGQILGASAVDVAFQYGPQGKPSIADGPCFNLSHSGDVACLAIHPTAPLGVDIEAFRSVEDGIAERFFSPTEVAALHTLPAEDQRAGFFRCWTRKEAVIKALGGGLSIPLDAFDVTLGANDAQLTRLDVDCQDAADWALTPFSVGQQMAGCVAAKTGGASLSLNLKDAPEDLKFNS